jgi:hypothetical protein
MEALGAQLGTGFSWLAGPLVFVLTLAAGCLAARLVHVRAARRRFKAQRTRLRDLKDQMRQLDEENRRLERALAQRDEEMNLLIARMGEATARDREELVHLQEELESDHRTGAEKARLIRASEAALHRARAANRRALTDRERQRASLAALQAALTHAKRAQASMEARLSDTREMLRRQTGSRIPQPVVTERVVERIVEIPVEKVVYRDREVPVEVPIEVPVGFTTFPAPPPVNGLKPRYSENRPSSA